VESDDPLHAFVNRKLFEHQPLIVESLVESGPQSVLQMIAITTTGVVTPLHLFSLALSITSMCSKVITCTHVPLSSLCLSALSRPALRLTYRLYVTAVSWNVDRPTFAFGSLCCVFDIIR
jgi:hypothetical protein